MCESEQNNGSGNNVTMQDVARRCGVSPITVSRALSGYKYVSQSKVELIRRVAKQMGYDPARQHAARQLAMRKSGQSPLNHVLAVFFPSGFYQDTYYVKVLDGLSRTVMPDRYALLAVDGEAVESPNQLPLVFERGDVDGAVIIVDRNSIVQYLRESPGFGNRPIISLINKISGTTSVLTDDYSGAYIAASYLLDLGHRHILHHAQAGDGEHVHDRRARGFRQAYIDRGIDPENNLRYLLWGFDIPDWNEDRIIGALRDNPEITAILALNDTAAGHIKRFLDRAGLSVPDDISLVGFDDTVPILNRRGANILTTVRLPLVEVGEEAARIMLERVSGEKQQDKTVLLPVELVVRGTTGPPKARHT